MEENQDNDKIDNPNTNVKVDPGFIPFE